MARSTVRSYGKYRYGYRAHRYAGRLGCCSQAAPVVGGANSLFPYTVRLHACGCRSGRQQDCHDAIDKEWLALFTADRRLTKSGIQHVQKRDVWFGRASTPLAGCGSLAQWPFVIWRANDGVVDLRRKRQGVWEASGAP
ncbi:hypothetical protein LI328DRAFT_126666 [Trichoderma asperelloides]|nr:hypothetical protein LI328DRAFT_126666 [Trichoderma asperelloides]